MKKMMGFRLHTKYLEPFKYNKFTFEIFLLLTTVVITLFTRTFHLTYQSLWFDELYSMCIANPENSFRTILSDIKTDFHPPLYYFILNTAFKIFPYTDFVGRIISAIIGISGVPGMYFLGKEIKNKRIGLLMAFLMSISLYQIKHSQEVRMYILLSLLAIISSIFFLKSLKSSKSFHLLIYTVVSATMMYTHYYGFFVVLAHFLCYCHLLISKTIPTTTIKRFAFAFLGMVVIYLPWVPEILATGGRQHFMGLKEPWYFFYFLYQYYGKEPLTTCLVFAGLFLFFKSVIHVNSETNNIERIHVIFILYGIVTIYAAPYLFSFYKPVINLPSTLSVLPFLIAAVTIGIDQFKRKTINLMIIAILISNTVNVAFINKYYTTDSKQNFRQISEKITNSIDPQDNHKVIAVSQLAKFYNYYINQLNSQAIVINPNEFEPTIIPEEVNYLYVINAPFTKERNRQLENIDTLGFLIMNPRISDRVRFINEKHRQWVAYIDQYYSIDSVFLDDQTKIEVAFRYKRKFAP